MPRFLRITFVIAAVLVVLIVGAIAVLIAVFPRVAPAPLMMVPTSPEVLTRGEHLFNHVCACVACHSQRDWSLLDGPVKPGSEGGGGDAFGTEAGIPGVIYGRNLTPAALSTWTDGELYRAITTGVDRNGRALFPLMPYGHYAQLAEADVHALIAYVRTLKPIANQVPERSLKFPMNLIVRTIPRDAVQPSFPPAATDPGYAAYVVNAAACLHCHSPSVHGAIAPGTEFTGGVPFPMPGLGIVRSANLTPDPTTGIGTWTKDQFVKRFALARETAKQPVKPGEFTSPMPWTVYAGMDDQELGAIWEYLHALPPVVNKVEKITLQAP